MMEIETLDQIVGWMQDAGLEALTLEERGVRLSLHLDGTPRVTAAPAEPERHTLTSAAMGRFLAEHPRRTGRRLEPGMRVGPGEIVGYLKAGATMTPIISDREGTVASVLVTDGDLIGFGDPIVTLTTD